MSVFDLFRGFFGVPGGHYRGDDRRDPLFDGVLHEDEDDEDDDGGFHYDDFSRSHQDPFDDALRFGFSFGPGIPSIEAPPSQDGAEKSRDGGGNGNSLRDFMLKSPERLPHNPPGPPPSAAPKDRDSSSPQGPSEPFSRWRPFSKFHDLWKDGLERPKEEERKEDGDLDSQVSSGGLDQILTPAPSQPKMRSFFKSVSVTKVVRPDGTVEERRTVRDSEGNEETTVNVTGGPDVKDQTGRLIPGGSRSSANMQDDFSLFSKFFGGFRD